MPSAERAEYALFPRQTMAEERRETPPEGITDADQELESSLDYRVSLSARAFRSALGVSMRLSPLVADREPSRTLAVARYSAVSGSRRFGVGRITGELHDELGRPSRPIRAG